MLNPIGLAYAAWLTLMTLLRLAQPADPPKAPPEEPPTVERPAAQEIRLDEGQQEP